LRSTGETHDTLDTSINPRSEPDNIPQDLLERAECVIVIPSMTKVALGTG
jgi:lipid-binding SYLF domain-containing protein